jgi:acyl-CoA thioester hydrolase
MSKEFSYRIYYEDTDASGVVYYANYLKFFERARTDYLRELGINQYQLEQEQKIIFMVRKCQIEYKDSARLDDLILVKTLVKKINGASITIEQELIRKTDQKLLNFITVDIVCIDSQSMKPTRIPKNIKTLLI